jgi:hypothetical protein
MDEIQNWICWINEEYNGFKRSEVEAYNNKQYSMCNDEVMLTTRLFYKNSSFENALIMTLSDIFNNYDISFKKNNNRYFIVFENYPNVYSELCEKQLNYLLNYNIVKNVNCLNYNKLLEFKLKEL